jgi:hypothetical protein
MENKAMNKIIIRSVLSRADMLLREIARVLHASLLICLLSSSAGIFAAALPEWQAMQEQPSSMLASQAALLLGREFNFDEDQQKMLSAWLNDMADPRFGFVDFDSARGVAQQIRAMPTQAGPADVKAGEREEKEDADGGSKVGKAIKKSPERQDIERVMREYLPPELVSSLVGDYAASVAPWNIKFEPGKVLKEFNCGPLSNLQASADGRYIAVQKGFPSFDEKEGRAIDIWDMQELRVFKQLTMEKAGGRWVFSPEFDTAAAVNFSTGEILIANAENGKIVQRIKISMDGLSLSHLSSSLSFFHREDGLYLIGADRHNTAFIWNVESGKMVDKRSIAIRPGRFAVGSGQFSVDGKLFLQIEGRDKDSLLVGKIKTGELVRRIKLATPNASFYTLGDHSHIFDFENTRVAALIEGEAFSSHILIWNLQTNQQVLSFHLAARQMPITFSPDGRYLLVGYPLGPKPPIILNLQACEREYREKVARGDLADIVTGRVVSIGPEAESKELAAVPAPVAVAPVPVAAPSLPAVSRRITVAQAQTEFIAPSTIRQRTVWLNGLKDLAKNSADRMINYEDAWQLYEEIKNR